MSDSFYNEFSEKFSRAVLTIIKLYQTEHFEMITKKVPELLEIVKFKG